MLSRALIATALASAAFAAPAAASVTMTALKQCYVSDGQAGNQRETVHVHATGFLPESQVELQIDSQPIDTGQADPFGVVDAAIPAPFQSRAGGGERAFTVTVVQKDNPANFATLDSHVSNLDVTLRPTRSRPSRKVRFRGRGFTKAAPVFAHYVLGGQLQKTVRLVRRPATPCGVFSLKRKQIPVRDARVGDWLLQVDQQRKWAARPASNMQALTIRVRETFQQP